MRSIATLENDDLFFVDEKSGDEDNGGNEVDLNEIESKIENQMSMTGMDADEYERIMAEQKLLYHRERIDKEDGNDNQYNHNDKRINSLTSKDGNLKIKAENILSDNPVKSREDKYVLKSLNIMDYVNSYRDSFFREVQELNLNVESLWKNWQIVKKQLIVSFLLCFVIMDI